MKPEPFTTATAAAKVIRDAAGAFEDPRQMYATQSLADYIESTSLPETRYASDRSYQRSTLAEIALAYMAGWEQAANERPVEMGRAIRAADLIV